jgi:hypothetical protein
MTLTAYKPNRLIPYRVSESKRQAFAAYAEKQLEDDPHYRDVKRAESMMDGEEGTAELCDRLECWRIGQFNLYVEDIYKEWRVGEEIRKHG